MRTLNDLEREAYIKGDTAIAALYGQLEDAELALFDVETHEDRQMYSDDEYEDLLNDFTKLDLQYKKLNKDYCELKARMEGLEK